MTEPDTLSAALRTLNNAAHAALRAALRSNQHRMAVSLLEIANATDEMVDDDA